MHDDGAIFASAADTLYAADCEHILSCGWKWAMVVSWNSHTVDTSVNVELVEMSNFFSSYDFRRWYSRRCNLLRPESFSAMPRWRICWTLMPLMNTSRSKFVIQTTLDVGRRMYHNTAATACYRLWQNVAKSKWATLSNRWYGRRIQIYDNHRHWNVPQNARQCSCWR